MEGVNDKKTYLFTGDIILGSPSSVIQDLPAYMKTLHKVKQLKADYLCLPHTLDNDPDSIMVEADSKISDYIKYREDRIKQVADCF